MHFHTTAAGAWPTLGVELELQIVDAATLDLRDGLEELRAAMPEGLGDALKPELYRACVEINTGVCRDVAEAGRDLGGTLWALERAAARGGMRLGWGGTHPTARWHERRFTPTERYRALADRLRETLLRQMSFGLHVHVGVPDGDAAARACTRLRGFIPALIALAANSPYWCGRDTGLEAYRAEVMAASPTGGLPPRLASWDEYAGLVDRLIACGAIGSPKELWWDARPNATLGTVEVRACDMPPDLPSVLALTALTQCLVRDLAADPGPIEPVDPALDLIHRQNRWRAARFGLDAEFADPRGGPAVPARRAIARLVDRLAPTARELGCLGHLEGARAMAEGSTGARRQRAVFERSGSLVAVARHLVGDRWLEPAPRDPIGPGAELVPMGPADPPAAGAF